MSKQYRKQNDCLNCGANVPGKFCGNCGQENLDLHEPFWHFISHSVSHYFHFDTKLFKTIVPLITKPGQLTLDYIEGKRTRYLQPISMFIFISIVYFLVIQFLNPRENNDKKTIDIVKVEKIELFSEYENNLSILPKQLRDFGSKEYKQAQINYFNSLTEDRQTYIIDSLNKVAFKQKNPSEIKGLINILKKGERESINESADLKKESKYNFDFTNILNKYGSKVFFLLTPIFAFFLMKNFRKNKKYYVEHIIFTVHFHSFAFITLLLSGLLNFISLNIISDLLGVIIFGIFVWYIYKSLKVVYQRARGVTIRKMITLGFLYFIAYSISIALVMMFVNYIPKQ